MSHVNILDDDGDELLTVKGNKGNSGRSKQKSGQMDAGMGVFGEVEDDLSEQKPLSLGFDKYDYEANPMDEELDREGSAFNYEPE